MKLHLIWILFFRTQNQLWAEAVVVVVEEEDVEVDDAASPQIHLTASARGLSTSFHCSCHLLNLVVVTCLIWYIALVSIATC